MVPGHRNLISCRRPSGSMSKSAAMPSVILNTGPSGSPARNRSSLGFQYPRTGTPRNSACGWPSNGRHWVPWSEQRPHGSNDTPVCIVHLRTECKTHPIGGASSTPVSYLGCRVAGRSAHQACRYSGARNCPTRKDNGAKHREREKTPDRVVPIRLSRRPSKNDYGGLQGRVSLALLQGHLV